MGKLLVVFKREYLERVRSKWFLVGTLLGPVFFALITVVPILISSRTKSSSDVSDVVIIDATGTGMGARVAQGLRERFPDGPTPAVRNVDAASVPRESDRATLEVQHKERRGYLVLDSATVAGRAAQYAGRNASSLGDVEIITSVVRQQVLAQRLQADGLDPARVNALTSTKLDLKTSKIGDNGREKGSGISNVIFGYVVALLLYMMIVLYGQTILRGVMEEKTTRVAEVVVSSVSTDTLLAGKILGVGLVAVTQVLAWVVLSIVLTVYGLPIVTKGMTPDVVVDASTKAAQGSSAASVITAAMPSISLGTGLALLAFFILGFIFYSSLFAAIGAMVNSQEDVQQASMPVMLLLISSVIFMTPIMTNPGSTLATTMSLLPFSAPILMPLRMTLIPVPWYEVLGSILGVVVACLVAIWLSARIYRVGLLMYGKRPTFSELARWVKYSN
jgi:ABC-2 type transport system permease protein